MQISEQLNLSFKIFFFQYFDCDILVLSKTCYKIFKALSTVRFTDLDLGSETIIFESIQNTFEDSWGINKNQLKIEPSRANLACPNR